MSNKPVVVVTRTGSPFYVSGMGSSPRGDLDTEPVVRELAKRDDIQVVFFGVVKGAERLPMNVEVINVRTQGITAMSSAEELRDAWDTDIDRLIEMNPRCWIDVFGYTPSWSWPDNPNGAQAQDSGVRYSAPMLYAMHRTKAPRYGIVTDPKCYKRDLEMALMWPECVPQAVLSQEDRIFDKKIGGKKYQVHAVYAACEFWLTKYTPYPKSTGQYSYDVAICANTHIGEARLPKNRDMLWTEILDQCVPERTRICGAGWEKHPYYVDPTYADMFVGVLPTFGDVMEFIGYSLGGPMIPQMPGFNSTKPRMYALMDSVPCLFGTGAHPMTYDRDERILPLNHPARWSEYTGQPKLRDGSLDETIELVLERTEPNFSRLHDLIDSTILPSFTFRYPYTSWLDTFGGYVKL